MRLTANPFDLVGAGIEVTEGNLALIVSDHEIGEWPLHEVSIDVETDGFHMKVEGEEFVFTTNQADAFAAAVGIRPTPGVRGRSRAHAKTRSAARTVPAHSVSAVATPVRKIRAPRGGTPRWVKALFAKADISDPRSKIVAAATILVIALAIVARPVLAAILLFIGMAAVLLIGAAAVDPLVASRLPEGWSPSRLVILALTVIVSGLLLVAF
jgi:hypothetical protein